MDEERDDIDMEDVENFIDWGASDWEKEQIAEMCGYENNVVGDGPRIQVKTLGDQYKFELIAKLYKTYGTVTELEAALGSELLKKLEYVVV